jgi:hypothetical protein
MTWARPFGAVLLVALVLLLTSCSRLGMGQDEMTWARAALDRNTRLEVVASDPQAKTFTVRLKGSDKLFVVPVDQIVAGPGSLGEGEVASSAGVAAPTPPPQVSAEPSTVPEAPQEAVPVASGGASSRPNLQGLPSTPGTAPASADEPAHVDSAQSAAASADVQGPHSESASNAKAGSVLASGPGYSIKASGTKSSATRSSPATSARGTPVERLHDPIICQGSRMLHIDNRNLEFDGDAVNAQDGCELHITNSHISAKGIGVQVRAANVHIQNSEIEGDSGAIDASEGAQVYAESSRFKGLTRRMESSAFHDLGGNVWN